MTLLKKKFMHLLISLYDIYILRSAWALQFEICVEFCHVDFTCMNGFTSQSVLWVLLLRIHLWLFEYFFSRKSFCLLLCVLSLITLAQNMMLY